MKILDMKVLSGPNYWSNYRKTLIQMKLDLQQYEELPTNLIEGFTANLKKLIPTLYNHRCSSGKKGGFFNRLDSGTWLGHVVEHVALEIQWLAGMPCGFGRTRPTQEKGIYNVVFSYICEKAGIQAGEIAVNIVHTLATSKKYTTLENDIETLKEIYNEDKLGPSIDSIVIEAQKRNIPWARLNQGSLVLLGQGINQRIMSSTVSCLTSNLGVELASDKVMTKEILSYAHIPVPEGIIVKNKNDLNRAVKQLHFPVVIKPQFGNHGKGITTDIANLKKAKLAFQIAQSFSRDIIIEKFIKGSDYRLLVINYKFVAAAKRIPAMICGTGELTIQELIDIENNDPERGNGHENFLTLIKIDDLTLSILKENNYTLDTILPHGKILYLKNTANISSGGTAVDVTDYIHPDNILMAERIAKLIHLDICGIDIIAEDIAIPLTHANGAVLEVNAGPGFRMHLKPTKGLPRNVAAPVMDMLYPDPTKSRIPVVAVTGTNGKSTIVRLISHFANQAGFKVGHTSTEGINIQDKYITEGDCSGPRSAEIVLRDPTVDFAVLECARGGILRSGLGFDQCDISIISNISEDHLGQDNIHTLEELARVKSVVALSTHSNGYSILNADDDTVYNIKDHLNCNVGLFSVGNNNQRIKDHCANGKLAAYIENGFFVAQQGINIYQIARVSDIPLTFSGHATCMIKNILPAILFGMIQKFSIEDINKYLMSFKPTPSFNPGRMNFFDFPHFKVLIDYAHNEEAFIDLKNFISTIHSPKKIGIIAATGDRRVYDIEKVGLYAAQIFDEVIIRQDRDSRGKSHDHITSLILKGINQINKDTKITMIANEFEAIQYAMSKATQDTFIMYFPDEINKAVNYVQNQCNLYHTATKPEILA